MPWVARHIRKPYIAFFYKPEKLGKDLALLQVVARKENVFNLEPYEFVLPTTHGSEKYIGVIKRVDDDKVVIQIRDKIPERRRFHRLVLDDIYIPVGLIVEGQNKPIVGILKDFSLGGFRAKFSKRDFERLREALSGDYLDQVTALFRFPNKKELLKVKAAPVRFDQEREQVGFTFTFSTYNDTVAKIYKNLLKLMEGN